ncbi:Zinc finger protein 26 [Eumeta japonica]|uniref:Zinc finger protein 26 n=1 Tax=Eumeta variegata TaxID=151549 RepID=A0A4C1VU81_EUMVA|nr:Zinc finger protein 26 [Eumeta japonica]
MLTDARCERDTAKASACFCASEVKREEIGLHCQPSPIVSFRLPYLSITARVNTRPLGPSRKEPSGPDRVTRTFHCDVIARNHSNVPEEHSFQKIAKLKFIPSESHAVANLAAAQEWAGPPVICHTLTEYGCEVAAFIVVFHPVSASTGEREDIAAKPHRSKLEELMKKTMVKEMNLNTMKLIKNSNLTLFTWTKRKYRCFYCEKCFVEMATLKQHSSTHTLDEIDSRIGFVRQTELKKAEISNLACRLCPSSCSDLKDLINHLNTHNVVFESDSHLLIPYRLVNGKFECVFCEKSFQVYVKLSSHMNSHYQNYVCEICGAGFANRLNLSLHVRNSHYPTKCSQCDRIFKNLTEKSKHRAKEHNVQSRRFCPLCSEILPNAYAKLLHMNSAHGVKFPEHKCNHCDRIFKTKFFLNTHVRRQHLEEKNHVCDKCSMRFYTTADLKRHFKCHDSRKNFSCSYCDTMFKTKDSWRRHLKRTHNRVDSDSQCYSLKSSNS